MKVKIYRTCKKNPLPVQAHPGDAGFDVFSAEDSIFDINEIKMFSIGIIAQAPVGYHFKLCLRSSMGANRGFVIPNGFGIIDSGYAGPSDEMKMILLWTGKGEGKIKKGERVGQLILEKNNDIEWEEQEDRNFSGENRGGFGSSGK
jgi:dUTP pyrophosphatase